MRRILKVAGLSSVALAAFLAACGDDDGPTAPTTGSIQVTVSTTGVDIDADGYTFSIDGGSAQAIDVNGSQTVSGLAPGALVVQLGDVAVNCTVDGQNPKSVTVTAGQTVQASFSVTCSALTGDLDVVTTTTGADLDDQYTVSIDGGAPQATGANATFSVTGLPVGDHQVELGDVAANCLVSGANPRTVTVTGGGTAATTFSVVCSALTGDLDVITTTTGADPDDQYTVSIDGGAPQATGANATLSTTGLPVGDHQVELGDVAANCAVAGANPRTVSVAEAATAQTTFDVTCSALTGNIDVVTSTTGVELDADGYTFAVDGGAPQPVGVNETVAVLDLPVGDHDVELADIGLNCAVTGSNPVTVSVPSGGTAAAAFDVTCAAPAFQLVFVSERAGNREIHIMDGDGSNPVNLTNDLSDDNFPDVSPDGSKIVFTTDRDGNNEIYVMNIDGSGVTRLTNNGSSDIFPTWSPDGSKIAFTRGSLADRDIWVMDAGGSNPVALTSGSFDNEQPTWSPDGAKIAFRTDRDGNNEIYVMNSADGSGLVNLSNHADWDGGPSWSPDGFLISFDTNRDGNFEVYTMSAVDGSGQTNLTNDPALDGGSANRWTPDSRMITFASDRDGNEEIYTMNADGSNQRNRTGHPAPDRSATWVP
jgi:dipeptidyl aminopeptidase/acylaminoacyl peptidase